MNWKKENRVTRPQTPTSPVWLFAIAASCFFAPVAFSASFASAASLEPVALMTFSFRSNATGGETLKLESFKAGLSETPNYLKPAKRDVEVRVLDSFGRGMFSYWFSDPRYTYYDYEQNGALTGGKRFDANARFYVTVPLAGDANYAALFDAAGAKLIAVNLRTGLQVEEKEWKEIAPRAAEEKTGWDALNAWQIVLAAVAIAIAALAALGFAVFRKASAGAERGEEKTEKTKSKEKKSGKRNERTDAEVEIDDIG